MDAAWYKDWFNSPYYHQLYFNRNDEEAATFINNLIEHLNPSPNSLMLDVACGKGRHSRQLSSKGFDVTGIDLSEESISFAKQYENDILHFYKHDMRLPFWINYFDFAFNFFTSFGYFANMREHNNAIRTIGQSLKHKGTLVLDYLNINYAENALVTKSEKNIDGVLYKITKSVDDKFFYKTIEVIDPQLKHPLVYTEKVAKFSLTDFEKLFSSNGLKVNEVFGNYKLHQFDKTNSTRLILIAQKV